MNVERLLSIASALQTEMSSTGVVAKANGMLTSLENMVTNPSAPQFQQELSTDLASLRDELAEAGSNDFSPGWRQILDEIGIQGLFGKDLLARIDLIIESNQLTPSVAVDELRPIVTQLQETEDSLRALVGGLEHLGIESEDLLPREVEVSILIPREAVDNELPDLARELIRIQQFLGPFMELADGSRPALKVRAIASSDFGIYLDMGTKAAAYLAGATAFLINSYNGVLDIRQKRNELKAQKVPDGIIDQLTEHVESRMSTAITEYVDGLVADLSAGGREHELHADLRHAMNGIANRIDEGYHFDIRVGHEPENDADEEEGESAGDDDLLDAVSQIREVAPILRFIAPAGQHILSLEEGDPPPAEAADVSDQ